MRGGSSSGSRAASDAATFGGDVSHHRQRRPQFVGRVGGEPAGFLEGPLKAGDHAVERRTQPAELVVRVRHIQPAVETGGGDLLGLGRHPVDRGQRPTCQNVPPAEGEGERQRTGQQQGRQQFGSASWSSAARRARRSGGSAARPGRGRPG